MNMIMDNSSHPHQPQHQQHLNHLHLQHQHHQQQQAHTMPPLESPQRADLKVSTTPPRTLSPSLNNNILTNNNNNETPISPQTVGVGKTGLKRSFDVAFLMMPDERIKQKQAEKQARLSEALERPQYMPTDLSPRQMAHQQQQQHQQHHQHQQHLQLLHEQAEFQFQLQEARRYPQITIRSPRIYDDPSVVIPDSDSLSPIKSAFTKVVQARLVESPPMPQQPPPPALSPDQLSCPSMSPPVATTPPRTNSGNGSLSNGSNGGGGTPTGPQQLNPNTVVYQNFRPEYSFNGAFHSVNQVQALQAAAAQNHRIKQQLFYRPPLGGVPHQVAVPVSSAGGNSPGAGPPPPAGAPEFLPGYPGFPFPPSAAHHFAAIAPPEMPRIPLQNPAAAAILSTLIPPTLASTFTLTAQNVCAKCNISFRMTSDLVYHMRSHHKSEVACDPNRRKREEKLKCPVCNESFRERHHLTRHMTAHQDKESDAATPPTSSAAAAAASEPIINVGGGNGAGSSRHHSRAAAVSK